MLALFAGLAFNTPLSNLGSGMLVAFSQPLRLGDRVTVAEQTGYVEELNLLYTTLAHRRGAPRVHPEQPAHGDADRQPDDHGPEARGLRRVPRAARRIARPGRATLRDAAAAVAGTVDEPRVLVTGIDGGSAWVTVRVFTPLDADVASIESDVRSAGLQALGAEGLLAA